jgi:transposase
MQRKLIAIFKRWGMPESIRIDNGHPFGDPQRVTIPPLALWLIALNIRPIWNRPRRPTDNATVERMQGTTSRWAEVRRVDNLEQLQERLDRFVTLQREHYRADRLQGQTRLEAYPALKQPARRYLQDGFDANRVYAALAQSCFVRKVGSNGRITIYEQGYQVGTAWRHQSVQIQLDAQTRQWIIRDGRGQVIRRHKAKQLSPRDIRKLTVTQRT